MNSVDEQRPVESTAATAAPEKQPPAALTPELVREVTEKVYVLWCRDLKLERERRRFMPGPSAR